MLYPLCLGYHFKKFPKRESSILKWLRGELVQVNPATLRSDAKVCSNCVFVLDLKRVMTWISKTEVNGCSSLKHEDLTPLISFQVCFFRVFLNPSRKTTLVLAEDCLDTKTRFISALSQTLGFSFFNLVFVIIL